MNATNAPESVPPTATVADVLGIMKPHRREHVRTYLHGERDPLAPNWQRDRAVWTLTVSREPYGQDRRVESKATIEIPGWIGNGHKGATVVVPSSDGVFPPRTEYANDPSNIYEPRRGYMPLDTDRFRSILLGLPRRATLLLRLRLDYGNNESVIRAKLHADLLMMEATLPNGQVREFLLDCDIGEHNSARFGNGLGER